MELYLLLMLDSGDVSEFAKLKFDEKEDAKYTGNEKWKYIFKFLSKYDVIRK